MQFFHWTVMPLQSLRRRTKPLRAIAAACQAPLASPGRSVVAEVLEPRLLLTAVSFASPISLTTGGNVYAVVAADFNGDGKLDLATANYNTDSVSVLLGNGNGTFQPAVTYPVGNGPDAIIATELTHDGAMDLVTANKTDGTLSVLLGNGDGTFQAAQTVLLGAGDYPHALAAADFNGDGNVDLVTGNGSNSGNPGDTISLLLGNGDGTFAPATDFTVGDSPYALAVGEFTGDGHMDVATANLNYGYEGTVTLLRGRGNGTFKKARTFDVGYSPTSIFAADLNGDGDLDLVTADSADDTVSVLLGNGNGNFAARQTFYAPYTPQSVIVADINGDGIPDIITANPDGDNVSIFLGYGNGTFAPPVTYYAGTSPVSVIAGDFNGDGKPDLVTADSSNYNVSLLLNDYNGISPLITSDDQATFSTRSSSSFDIQTIGDPTPTLTETGSLPTGLTFTDNGDGTATLFGKPASAAAGVYDLTITAANGISPSDSQLFTLTVQRADQVFFAPGSPVATGTGPRAIVSADFNNDGKPDLATANSKDNTVSVMLGNGNGTFQSAQTIPAGDDPEALAAAILTGDGNVDLIVADDYYNQVHILLGNGNGTFSSGQYVSVGYSPDSIAVADVNGDGIPDIITANRDSNSVSVLLGNGNGTFQSPQTYYVGYGPKSVVAADLTGDGKMDLVTANYDADTLSILMGNGDGTFQDAQTIDLSGSPNSVIAADFNGDGKPDLATADYNSNTVSVLLNNGDGTFGPEKTYATDDNPVFVTAADVYGNGQMDLITANRIYYAGTVSVLLGNGDGTFQQEQSFAVGSAPDGVVAADFDGDGKMDLATANFGSNTDSVLLNKNNSAPLFISAAQVDFGSESDGSFTIKTAGGPTPSLSEVGNLPPGITFTDNGDGTATLTGTPGPHTVGSYALTITASNGIAPDAVQHFTLGIAREVLFTPGYGDISATIADTTGDGKPDLITSDSFSNTVSVFPNKGNGKFAKPLTFNVGNDPRDVIAAKLTGDGKNDIVTLNSNYDQAGSVSVLLGKGNGKFKTQMTFPVGNDPRSVVAADFNGDHDLDLAVANRDDDTVSILMGNGDGTFKPQTTVAVGNYPDSVVAADVNGDGIMDLIVANAGDNTVSVLLGNGNGTFRPAETFAVGAYPKSVVAADFNGDGKIDLATANANDNTVSVLLGNGDGTFANQMTFAVDTDPYAIAAADINGDGKLDLITANHGANDLSILFGNGDGTFQPPLTFSVGSYPGSLVAADINGDTPGLVVAGYASASVLTYIPTIAMAGDGMVMVGGTSTYDTASTSMASNGDVVVNIDGQSRSFAPAAVNGVNVNLGAGNDNMAIGAGTPAAVVVGGAGNDTIAADNNGGDTLKGGGGDDFFLDSGTTNADVINGGGGLNFAINNPNDTSMKKIYQVIDPTPPSGTPAVVPAAAARIAPADELPISVVVSGTIVSITGTSGDDSIAIGSDGTDLTYTTNDGVNGSIPLSGLTGLLILGGAGRDTISVDPSVTLPATLKGGSGGDSLVGGGGDNVLIGAGGSDTLVGGAGTNLLVPDSFEVYSDLPAGSDVLDGGTGYSIADLSYRTDNLYLSNDGQRDSGDAAEGEALTIDTNVSVIWGGTGNDTMVGTKGGVFLSGGDGADTIHGGGVGDVLVGGSGSDTVAVAAEPVSLFLKDGQADDYYGVNDPSIDILELDTGLDVNIG